MSLVTTALEYALLAIHVVGLPALFVVFVLKGALVGKLLPTSVVLSGYVAVTAPDYRGAAVVVLLVTVAYLIGQFALYAGSRRYGKRVVSVVPYVDLDPTSEQFLRVERWFDQYGGAAVFTTNVFPWTRGLIVIPAGVSAYPCRRYLFHASTSALLYHGVYVGLPLLGLSLLT